MDRTAQRISPFVRIPRRILRGLQSEPKKFLYWYILRNRAVSPPDIFKRRLIKTYAARTGIKTFIETGTYKGDAVYAVRNAFESIYSIELHKPFFEKSSERFQQFDHIHTLYGDSPSVLKQLMPNIKEPCLFWLDAHGGEASLDDSGNVKPAPVIEELQTICNHLNEYHVILIDDAHTFRNDRKWGKGVWSKLRTMRKEFLEQHSDWKWYVRYDILHIHKHAHL